MKKKHILWLGLLLVLLVLLLLLGRAWKTGKEESPGQRETGQEIPQPASEKGPADLPQEDEREEAKAEPEEEETAEKTEEETEEEEKKTSSGEGTSPAGRGEDSGENETGNNEKLMVCDRKACISSLKAK